MNIYIGNMSFETTEEKLRSAFSGYGQVSTVKIITDRETGQARGFAFVEMPTSNEAASAISGLNGQDLDGRTLNVTEAKPRADQGNREVNNNSRRAY